MPNSKKKLMILGAGEIQVPVILKAKNEGYYVIVVDFDKSAPGFKFADIKLVISTHNEKEILEQAVKYNIDGILTTSDFPVRVVASIAEKLGLKALNKESANICTDKFLLRQKIKESNLNYPNYILAETISDLSVVDYFPAIIKPIDSSASKGVKKVNSKEELIKEFEISISYSNSKKVIVEEFIEGNEFSVESLTYNGKTDVIAITEKNKIGEDKGHFVEYSHKIPANITEQESELIKQTTLDIIKVINLDNSSSHTEIILSNNKAYIVEIGARLGGDYIASDLVYLSNGVDMLKNIIKMSVNEENDIKTKYNMYSAIQFITPDNYLSANSFIESNNKQMIKFDIKPYKNIIIKNSLDRLGYIIIQTSTKNELENLLNKINNENK
jgi:carbamoyl-phosphate synthase large subunit